MKVCHCNITSSFVSNQTVFCSLLPVISCGKLSEIPVVVPLPMKSETQAKSVIMLYIYICSHSPLSFEALLKIFPQLHVAAFYIAMCDINSLKTIYVECLICIMSKKIMNIKKWQAAKLGMNSLRRGHLFTKMNYYD